MLISSPFLRIQSDYANNGGHLEEGGECDICLIEPRHILHRCFTMSEDAYSHLF